MKEQIKEMRKEVSAIHRFFMEDDDYEYLDDYIADELYNAGYRKQKEGEWINPDIWLKTMYCSICGAIAPVDCEKEEFYKSNFCPDCGAKMKGGAE